ncbi:MAG TPA: CYTH and CHAD domain-containing protein [Acidimicrobiales bacterium]
MATTEHLEREFKLTADLDFELPDLGPIVGHTVSLPAQALHTSYFDTADLRLWGRGITLRHRTGEEANGGLWTIKLPETEGEALERTELTWPGSRGEVPVEARTLLRGIIRRADLREVVELESKRRRVLLGSSLGEIDDDVVTVKSGQREGFKFRQIELELKMDAAMAGSSSDQIHDVLHALHRSGANEDRHQKFTMALGLSEGRPKERKRQRGKKATISAAVELSIGDGLDRVLDHDVRLRLRPGEPPRYSIHQARVATRRLRSDIKTFARLLDPIWVEHVSRDLKWLGAVFGQVRDLDVLSDRLESAELNSRIEREGRIELSAKLARQRGYAGDQLTSALDSDRYFGLIEHLAAAARLPPFIRPSEASASAADVLPVLVQRQYKALLRRIRHGGRHPNDTQLHQIRIGAKQLRYAAETAAPFIGKSARRTGGGAKDLQTILGEHHDAVSAEVWLRQATDEGSSAAGFTAGRLVEQARRQKLKRAKRWRQAWRSIQRSSKQWL